tara:strand:+ start:227 stop:448 length:222 start_codon:yes stop_codon:yes gene_type:complete
MKKIIIDAKTQTETVVDLTAEELAQREIDIANSVNDKDALTIINEQKDLKASAKAKLIAGEALTKEEADTIVI